MDADPRFLSAVRCLERREWFAAHEAFEDLWREASGAERTALQGLIHAAVALEHLRRGRREGARSQWAKARQRLRGCSEWYRGVGVGAWQRALAPLLDGAEDLTPPETWPTPPLAAALRARL